MVMAIVPLMQIPLIFGTHAKRHGRKIYLLASRSIAEKALGYVRMIDMHLFKLVSRQRCDTYHVSILKWSSMPTSITGNCWLHAARSNKRLQPQKLQTVAIRHAIGLAKDEGFSNVIISSDCQSLVNRIAMQQRWMTDLLVVLSSNILGRRQYLSQLFIRACYAWLNVLSLKLAELTEFLVCSMWCGCTPDWICEYICNDILIR
jgi:hypothetical protein